MNELELFKDWSETKKRIQWLKISLKNSEKDKAMADNSELNDKILLLSEIRIKLLNAEDKSFSEKAKYTMTAQLNEHIKALKLKLSRNQGVNNQKEIFERIISDLELSLKANKNAAFIRIPEYVLAKNNLEKPIKAGELISFLEDELKRLNCIKDVNYVELSMFLEKFSRRILNHTSMD